MSCKCGSSRIATVGAYQIPEEYMEFSIKEDGKAKKGYFPCEIGDSDSIQFSFLR